jgi:hypothetical protein
MRARAAAVALALAAPPATAQEVLTIEPPTRIPLGTVEEAVPEVQQPQVASAAGALLRALDKITGVVTDFEIASGQTVEIGNLTVTLGDCRYPVANPAGDAFVLVSVRTIATETAIFEGWLIASSPALSALDHPRYDLWALRCRQG